MANFYCEYCGILRTSVASLTNAACSMHPLGPSKGKHKLYEGSEKPKYTCKYCGTSKTTIASLTNAACSNHPNGFNKGKHSPAL